MIRFGKYLEFLWSGKKEKINVLSCSLITLERLMDNSNTLVAFELLQTKDFQRAL